MKRILVALAMIVAIATPASVQAVSCAPMQPGLPGFELVVRGAISAIPKGGIMHLRASRYYKGTGPWLLVTEVAGILVRELYPREKSHRPSGGDRPSGCS